LHTAVDDYHQATLKAIASDFAGTAAGRADLTKGMRKALALRDSFWSWLHERAMAGQAGLYSNGAPQDATDVRTH
jgi:hypothetical protein